MFSVFAMSPQCVRKGTMSGSSVQHFKALLLAPLVSNLIYSLLREISRPFNASYVELNDLANIWMVDRCRGAVIGSVVGIMATVKMKKNTCK